MSTAHPEASDFAARLAGAERRVRRLERLLVFLLLGFVLTFVTTFIPHSPIVAAQGFVLFDKGRHPRAELTLREEDGSPALRLDNAQGRAQLMMNARGDGSVFVRLSDDAGQNRAVLELDPAGAPSLWLAAPNGSSRVRLGVNAAGTATAALEDSAGRVRWSSP